MKRKYSTKTEKKKLKKEEKKLRLLKKEKAMKRKKYVFWIGVVIFITGLLVFLKIAFTPPAPGSFPELTTYFPEDHVKGATESAHLLIEYSDFQCPACRAYYPITKEFVKNHQKDILFVYRHFPLNQHKNAKQAAYAAEAAGKQGKFWEMHDMLFEHQTEWENASDPEQIFNSYAQSLQLDMNQFKKDSQSEIVRKKVDTDYASGVRFSVNATPTFFYNGKKVTLRSINDFENLLKNK